ncbi:Isocitrate dehydrogenase kinase/phosphatase (IDH kinase/phosphatase) (EC 2.7.11.5) (EC 3.1.3.-) [Mycetohabitans rhizoxinica HKI 454]|uniref:Isocitrate dehydrogenase kinase/phosphatase (IDH kinase/phosphatase) n=1 Tax=Mycetohabitans rhizoxinica (strain DSM 19002 / CIP 109453 / HKI 454) TaxID=882378 RepID=E5AMK3_MYCRK|nr:Isocitrate dehydrogenase kinase/phosphatase (IDH kinase/phosphatase) (EC 2.7.11.5) (EC 3.1.3.-) [Mycetohabitans rhizoxinica HKI 454]
MMKYLPKLLLSQIGFDLAQTILKGFNRVITGSFAKPRSTRNASSSAAIGTGYRSARERSASSRMSSSMCCSRICHATWTA